MICKLFKKSYFSENFIKMVKDYSQEKRNYINIRYIRIVKNLERSTMISAFYYYLFSTLITLLSIIVPSLLSIQDRTFKANPSDDDVRTHNNTIFWVIWTMSILITISNALIKLFKLDQTYITRSLRLNQLRSEGVMYVNGIEDYEDGDDEEKFKKFIQNIEKLKNIQIKQEFTQSTDLERKDVDLTTIDIPRQNNLQYRSDPANVRRVTGSVHV